MSRTESRFNSDPEALAWAREGVQSMVDKLRRFEKQAREAPFGDRNAEQRAHQWRVLANMLQMDMIGGKGCAIAVFDERLPALIEQVPDLFSGVSERGN